MRKDPPETPKSDKHPVVEAAELGEAEARELFREVASQVRYAEFSDAAWETFRAVKRLAMLDLWSALSEAKKLDLAGLAAEAATDLRGSALYERVLQALGTAFQEAATPKTAAQWVAAMEDVAFRRLARVARYAVDPKVASAAARDFADRALPKVSRNTNAEGQAPVLMITEDGARLLLAALETVQKKARQALPEPPPALDAEPWRT